MTSNVFKFVRYFIREFDLLVHSVGFLTLLSVEKKFANQVLLNSSVTIPFLRNPARLRFHHNFPGGLLAHSTKVAAVIAGAFNCQEQRDIAVTAALFHDVGKTVTITKDMQRTATGSMVDHSALTLEVCASALSELNKQSPFIADQLRHAWTSDTPNSRYGFKPKTHIARMLQKIDRDDAQRSVLNS